MMWKAPLGSRLRAGVSLTVIIGSLAIAMPATAQTTQGSGDAVALLMKSLREKGILSESEYQMMLARLNASPASQTASANQAPNAQQAAVPAATNPTSQVAATSTPSEIPAEAAERQALGDIKMVGDLKSGVGLTIGDVRVNLHASVNGYYVHQSGSDARATSVVNGGVAQVGQDSSAIRSGFAPAYILADFTTKQRGWDVGAHFGFYPGITSTAGQPNALGVPEALQTGGLDVRQVNLTVGRAGFGEVKIGRDVGLFAQDATFNDIALLGMGVPPANPAPTNSTLGRIGSGYLYTDWIPQITYTTPDLHGFKVSVGAFQPLRTVGSSEINSTPGFQYRVTYTTAFNDLSVYLWSAGIIQRHDPLEGSLTDRRYTGKGIDGGAKLGYGPFGLVGYYYTGNGLGNVGLFLNSVAANGNKRDSDGFYVQGTYKLGDFQLGGSYGGSRLDLARDEPISNLLKDTYSYSGQLRYSLTNWVTLIGEYTHVRSTAHNDNRATSDTIVTGATLAF